MAPGQTVTFNIQRTGMDAQPQKLTTLTRDLIVAHSLSTLAFLATKPALVSTKNVSITLRSGSPAAFRRVLTSIRCICANEELEVNARDLNTVEKLAVWHACKELQLQPVEAEYKIFRTIMWDLTHDKLTPQVMQAAWDIISPYRNDASNDMYQRGLTALAHQYVWDMLHGRFSREEQTALEGVYAPIPQFGMMIGDKQDELEPKKKEHDMWKEKERSRGAKKKHGVRRERNEREKQQRIERQAEEVLRGERALTKELEPYVFARRQGKYI